MEMSVTDIKQNLAACVGQAAGMDQSERVKLAAKAVGLFLSEGPDNPPVTFGAIASRSLKPQHVKLGRSSLAALLGYLLMR